MKALDFKYDDRWLSDAGYIICTFGTGGTDTIDAGSNIEFHTVPQHGGRSFALTHSNYTEGYTTTFSICKDADSEDEAYIYESDIRYIMRWLNRRDFHEFIHVGYRQGDNTELVMYGSFNVHTVEFAGRVIGFELTFVSNAPYAYGPQIEESFEVDSANGYFEIDNLSDEIGFLSPDRFTITCLESSNLQISNSKDSRNTYISGCSNGEIITMDCKNQIISTSVSGHDIQNDFNYNFPRLFSADDDVTNRFTVSIPCTVTIVYHPVRKVVL